MKVEIEPTTRGSRGQRYRVLYQGEALIESARNPEHDACRALLARGITGTLEVWHRGASHAGSRIDIACGAKWTVRETEHGLILAPWVPWTGGTPADGGFPVSPLSARGDSASLRPETPDKVSKA